MSSAICLSLFLLLPFFSPTSTEQLPQRPGIGHFAIYNGVRIVSASAVIAGFLRVVADFILHISTFFSLPLPRGESTPGGFSTLSDRDP